MPQRETRKRQSEDQGQFVWKKCYQKHLQATQDPQQSKGWDA